MEKALASWFTVADELVPQWYESICGDIVVGLEPVDLALHVDRVGHHVKFREVLQIFALAHALDAAAFFLAICSYKELNVPNTSSIAPWKSDTRLRFRLHVKISPISRRPEPGLNIMGKLTAFFRNWSEETASSGYAQTRDQLLDLSGKLDSTVAPLNSFDMDVQLELLAPERQDATVFEMVNMMRSINRSVFTVTDVTLQIVNEEYTNIAYESLLELLHGFRDTANIHFRAAIPSHSGYGFWPLIKWKRRFDLLTTSPSSSGDTSTTASHVAFTFERAKVLGPSEKTSSSVRVLVACLSALAHPQTHVAITSIHLTSVLQRHEGDSGACAKWLGYLLRVGTVKKLRLSENMLTMRDVEAIEAVFSAPTLVERLRALWCPMWRDDGVSRLQGVRVLIADETRFIGVMHDDSTDTACVEVLLAGYGQCRVDRQLVEAAVHDREQSSGPPCHAGLPPPLLESLTLTCDSIASQECIVRLISLVGPTLKELVLEGSQWQLHLASLVAVVEACPNLERLSIAAVVCTPGAYPHLVLDRQTNTLQQLPLPWTADPPEPTRLLLPPADTTHQQLPLHPLEALTIGLVLDTSGAALVGFANVLGRFAVGLKELRVRSYWFRGRPSTLNRGSIEAMTDVFRRGFQSLTILDVADLHAAYFEELLTGNALGYRPIHTLHISGHVWTDQYWRLLMDLLSDNSHPLTRSLHTMVIRLEGDDDGGTSQKVQDVMAMLPKNFFLTDVCMSFQGLPGEARIPIATNGVSVHRRDGPLPLRHKLALLNVVRHFGMAVNSDALRSVFVFAARTKKRRVRLSGHS